MFKIKNYIEDKTNIQLQHLVYIYIDLHDTELGISRLNGLLSRS